jgi:uncharacterized RDD family membrane protein YckC
MSQLEVLSAAKAPIVEPDPARLKGVLWRRPLAYFVDAAIVCALYWVAFVLLLPLWVISLGTLSPVMVLSLGVVALAYHSLLIGGSRSATLGQRLFGLEVRRLDGGRPDLLQAFVLTALFYITVALTSTLILLVALFTRHHRTVHDMLTGTLTLRRANGPEILMPGSGARTTGGRA